MTLRKADDFIADIEGQFDWYVVNASWEVAERYLDAVAAACALLASHPLLGPVLRSAHPRLQGWRFFVVFPPFNKHVIFYEVTADDVLMRRTLHGHRNLPRRLLESPGA